jgi:hypothetical protein
MTPEGILTNDELKFDSTLGAKVVRMLHAKEVVELHRARERQIRIAAKQEERRIFGDGATVTMSLDPVIAMRLMKDPRFGDKAFGEKEFKKDMKKWHPEFMVKTRKQTRHFALGAIQGAGSKPRKPYDKDSKYLVGSVRSDRSDGSTLKCAP